MNTVREAVLQHQCNIPDLFSYRVETSAPLPTAWVLAPSQRMVHHTESRQSEQEHISKPTFLVQVNVWWQWSISKTFDCSNHTPDCGTKLTFGNMSQVLLSNLWILEQALITYIHQLLLTHPPVATYSFPGCL